MTQNDSERIMIVIIDRFIALKPFSRRTLCPVRIAILRTNSRRHVTKGEIIVKFSANFHESLEFHESMDRPPTPRKATV